jgi:molybdopterin molybdotransferase
LLTFEEARAAILAGAARLGTERVALADAVGRVLGESVVAQAPLPPFDYSAMDGYAVRLSDFEGGTPVSLRVQGLESRAGRSAPALEPAAACRIFTGAELPSGANAVVMQEEVTREGEQATFSTCPPPRAHIRAAGSDIRAGDVAIIEGTRLGPGHLSLAASLDQPGLIVARRPIVAIVCTGDELRAPGSAGTAASIPESNSVALAALVRQAGGEPRILPAVGDDLAATAAALDAALGVADLLITVGGVSVGDHDLVRPSLIRVGVTVDLYKVAIKPGKPLTFGRRQDGARTARVLGLPGNPASALITFALFGAPLLRALQGDAAPLPLPLPARLKTPLSHKPGRLELVRVTLERDGRDLLAVPLANQASGATTSTGWASALAFVPSDAERLEAGTELDVVRWTDV